MHFFYVYICSLDLKENVLGIILCRQRGQVAKSAQKCERYLLEHHFHNNKQQQNLKEKIIFFSKTFKVQAFSCEGGSDISLVSGFCFTSRSSPANILGIVSLTVVCLLTLILVVRYIFNKRYVSRLILPYYSSISRTRV